MFRDGVQDNPFRNDQAANAFHAISQPGYAFEWFSLEWLKDRFHWEPPRRAKAPRPAAPKWWRLCLRTLEALSEADWAKVAGRTVKAKSRWLARKEFARLLGITHWHHLHVRRATPAAQKAAA
jgi:hypothetical protein